MESGDEGARSSAGSSERGRAVGQAKQPLALEPVQLAVEVCGEVVDGFWVRAAVEDAGEPLVGRNRGAGHEEE
jgi:hypothetical protein